MQYEPLTLFNGQYTYPDWGIALGWLMIFTVVLWVPIWMFYECYRSGGKEVRRTL